MGGLTYYGKPPYKWDGSILKVIKNLSKLSTKDFALKLNLFEHDYMAYEAGNQIPDLNLLIKIADYSGAPMDYLMGRRDSDYNPEEMCKAVRLGLFQDWVNGGRRPKEFSEKESFWPYNFLESLMPRYVETLLPLSEDHLKGIDEAISILDDRERTFILEYYKEEKSFSDIARTHSLSGTRVSQIIQEAEKKIRYGGVFKYIRYGKEGAVLHEKNESLEMKKSDIERKTAVLEKKIEYVEQKKAELAQKLAAAERVAAMLAERTKTPAEHIEFSSDYLDNNIEELGLSVRSFNCLKRSGINTVRDLVNKTPEDIMKVRNLGKKCLEEILDKRKDLDLYFISAAPEPPEKSIISGNYYNLHGLLRGQCQKYVYISPSDGKSGTLRYVALKSGYVKGYEWTDKKPIPYTLDKGDVLCIEKNETSSEIPELVVCDRKLVYDEPDPKDRRNDYISLPFHTTYLYFEDKTVLSGGYSHYENGTRVQFVFFSDGSVNYYKNVIHTTLPGHDPYYTTEFQTDGRYIRFENYLLISLRNTDEPGTYEDRVYAIIGNQLCADVYIDSKEKEKLEQFYIAKRSELHR